MLLAKTTGYTLALGAIVDPRVEVTLLPGHKPKADKITQITGHDYTNRRTAICNPHHTTGLSSPFYSAHDLITINAPTPPRSTVSMDSPILKII
ncbi:hypothetical protein TorRG33x02_195590 [Trema orientale]|uniref:Uncharacterized protein n=1 Tax=Trema orientale TaxID=63057 RepID=A0A2P5EGF6_TREOI|nr:hypothetical protein TorRG33x02_195590 [Trema orientale]